MYKCKNIINVLKLSSMSSMSSMPSMPSMTSMPSMSSILSLLWLKVGELGMIISEGEEICESNYNMMVKVIKELKKLSSKNVSKGKRGRPRKSVPESEPDKLTGDKNILIMNRSCNI